jgi:hypothetical protein
MTDARPFDRAATDPSFVDPTIDARAVSFESPDGARGAGGSAAGGRKGRPNKLLHAGERLVLADLEGPGTVRHIWCTFPSLPPEQLRGLILEVFYDGADEPSASVPLVDFFGVPHGRPVDYQSALTSILEGRGFNSYVPMPFRERIRIELWNSAEVRQLLYYQIDYTLQPGVPDDVGLLHVSFRRENPTTLRQDFVIADGFRGPGRFLGCNVGVRVIDHADWYGEGEVKVYRDGDTDLPTICGTGLEDYVGSAWGLGRFHSPHSGAPLVVTATDDAAPMGTQPDLVGFYRWHLLDPIMFEREIRVTIQQIGAKGFAPGQEAELEAYQRTNPVAGNGWLRDLSPALLAWGIAERRDDCCATAFVYCTEAQPVPRVDPVAAAADVGRVAYEAIGPTELLGLSVSGLEGDPLGGTG